MDSTGVPGHGEGEATELVGPAEGHLQQHDGGHLPNRRIGETSSRRKRPGTQSNDALRWAKNNNKRSLATATIRHT